MAMMRSSVRWISLWVVLALILGGWVLRTESASPGGTVSADVTAQIRTTFSGLRYNRATQTYDTVATLTNTSADPIHAPLELHIASITPATVALQNPSGTASDGHPYVAVPLPTGTLAPGATVTNVVLRFRNPGNVQFSFTHHLIGTVAAGNTPPVANAGADQSARIGETVTLDGSASTDAEGDALSYGWTLPTAPAGSTARLADSTTVNPRLTLDKPGDYTARQVVNDGQADSAPDTVTISTTNTPPVAQAGPDQSAPVGATVTLDGSASSDVDGDALTFQWTPVAWPEGLPPVLANPASVNPGLTLARAGAYTVQLIVNDGRVDSAPDSVTVSTENSRPVAEAGPAQTVPLNATVQLNGAGSRDADGDPLTYRWTLTSAPGALPTLENPTAVNPSFVANQPGEYVAQLVVNDGKVDSDPDTVTVSTENSKPVANAGSDQAAETGQTVVLDGTGSRDADSDPLTYQWALTTQPVGSQAALQDAGQAQAQFIPDLAGSYIAQLIVNDGLLASDPDTATITVTEPTPTNRAPTITSTAIEQATVGQPYSYQVVATDPDAGDVLAYSLSTKPDGMAIDAATGLVEWTPTTAGGANVAVRVTDRGGLFAEQSFTVTVAAATANQAPQVTASANPATVTLPTNGVALDGTVTDDGLPDPPGAVTVTWSKDASSTGTGTVTFGDAGKEDTTATFSTAGTYVLRLTASDGDKSAFATVTVTVNAEDLPVLPSDPGTVAPQVDATVATTTYAATQFLYSGANPIQTGVAPGTIEAKRAAVIRGRVLDKQNNPLPAVVITVLNHPEFGQTLSRADGGFDMAVNGGGYLTINYQRNGYLPAQRQINVPWQDYVTAPEAILILQDSQVTTVDLTANVPMQVARGSVQTDADGARQATLLFPQGTQATMVLANGSTQPLTRLNVRATEYTVGPNGPKAMPAELPPTSAYTYAVELSVDEAQAAGAKEVVFSQPVLSYVENFLNFPVGMAVPAGYYDRAKGAWIPSNNGRVIKVLAINGGLADVDTDGDNAADDATQLAALGVTDAERTQLASLYTVGQSLWRVPVTHFTPWDYNWPFITPADGKWPREPEAQNGAPIHKPNCDKGSIIECQNQILRETVGVTGTPFSLNYTSDRTPGRRAAYTLSIPLSDATVPASLKQIELEVTVAGRTFTQTFPAMPNQKTTFVWDGLDAYGRTVQGQQPVKVRVGYVYDAVYAGPAAFQQSFGSVSAGQATNNRTRQEITLWQESINSIGVWNSRKQGLEGWTLSVHHAYDIYGKTLYLGNGGHWSIKAQGSVVINTVAGGSVYTAGNPYSVAVGPNGVVYFASSNALFQVGPDGAITRIPFNFSGQGGNGSAQNLAVAVGPNGDLYVASSFTDGVIWRIKPDGAGAKVAGNGMGYGGDGGPAIDALFYNPTGIAVGPDGSLYIADSGNQRIRRIGPDGIITTVTGNGTSGFSGDGGPATQAQLWSPQDVALGPDGSLYIGETFNHRVRRVAPDGAITTVAGSTNAGWGNSGDGGPATQAMLAYPSKIAVGPDGSLYIKQSDSSIRQVRSDGIIVTIAGSAAGYLGDSGDGGPATQALMQDVNGMTVRPDGSLYVAEGYNHRIRRISPVLPGFTASDFPIASEDGSALYQFDASGRHLHTLNALTGATLYSFAYDGAGRLTTITDGDVTTIQRDGSGNAVAIVGPFGQPTALSRDANGYLASVTNPAGESYQMQYTADGLLTRFTDPKGQASTMSYDAQGYLLADANAAGGSQSLARTEFDGGHTVGMTSALGRTTSYRLETLPTNDERRVNTFPDGTQSVELLGTNGGTRTTLPDGTVTDVLETGDPRFSMQAPITQSATTTTGGLTSTLTAQRTVNLSDPNNLLSLTSQTDTVTLNGRTATSVYTAASRTATATSPMNRQSRVVTDLLGRPTQAQVGNLLPVNTSYDSHGRPSSTTQGSGADARTVGFSYNGDGYLDTVTDPLGRTVRYVYDAAGRVTTQTLPDGRQIQYGYDAKGNLTSLTPPGRPAHAFSYTAVDLTERYTPPAVAGVGDPSTTYSYNADKQLTQVNRPDGLTIGLAYDSAGRLSAQTTPDGAYSYVYNGAGQLSGVTAPDGGALAYSYSGSLLTQTAWSGTVAGSVNRTYDNDFRLASISVNGADPVSYGYDSLLTQAGSLTLSRRPDDGLLAGTTLGGVSDALNYNGFGEVTDYSATVGGAARLAVQYTYDNVSSG